MSKLQIPEEPKEIQSRMKAVKNYMNDPIIDWDGYVVWSGTQHALPSYLWEQWQDELKPMGWDWQKFTKMMRSKTERMIFWYKGLLSWGKFIDDIFDFINGPYGQDLARRKTKHRNPRN
jgi:hypothetical protein